jgi:hypothetical protein
VKSQSRPPLFPETLLASGDFHNNKDDDRHSTENGSSNGGDYGLIPTSFAPNAQHQQPTPPALDPGSVLAAREKSLISRAMDTVAKQVRHFVSEFDHSRYKKWQDLYICVMEGQVRCSVGSGPG